MKKILLLAISLLFLTGCGGQELSNVSLVRTLGIDGLGPVTVTAVTGAEGEQVLFAAAGEDVIAAQRLLETLGSKRLAVTHVGQVVLGEKASPRALWDEVLHRDSGYGATVWLAEEGSAHSLLSGSDDPAGRLKHLEESGIAAPSLMEVVSALARDGRVSLPVVGVRGGGLEVVGAREITAEGVFQ